MLSSVAFRALSCELLVCVCSVCQFAFCASSSTISVQTRHCSVNLEGTHLASRKCVVGGRSKRPLQTPKFHFAACNWRTEKNRIAFGAQARSHSVACDLTWFRRARVEISLRLQGMKARGNSVCPISLCKAALQEKAKTHNEFTRCRGIRPQFLSLRLDPARPALLTLLSLAASPTDRRAWRDGAAANHPRPAR